MKLINCLLVKELGIDNLQQRNVDHVKKRSMDMRVADQCQITGKYRGGAHETGKLNDRKI